jgi:hypothetical protein
VIGRPLTASRRLSGLPESSLRPIKRYAFDGGIDSSVTRRRQGLTPGLPRAAVRGPKRHPGAAWLRARRERLAGERAAGGAP